MMLDKRKTRIAMARACMGKKELAENATVPEQTVNRAINGHSVRPVTVGRIAAALGCDVLDILADEEKED